MGNAAEAAGGRGTGGSPGADTDAINDIFAASGVGPLTSDELAAASSALSRGDKVPIVNLPRNKQTKIEVRRLGVTTQAKSRGCRGLCTALAAEIRIEHDCFTESAASGTKKISSTTTKAILIEFVNNEYRLTYRGEAPTTVEAPFEDVTKGVLNAVMEVEELSGRTILDGDKIITPDDGSKGVDIYVSTSSAGGGLQMMVAGVVKSMSGESAERAAFGAGSIVMDVLASNDGRLPHEKITRILKIL